MLAESEGWELVAISVTLLSVITSSEQATIEIKNANVNKNVKILFKINLLCNV